MHVRTWETHLQPRRIARDGSSSEVDTFGIIDGVEKIDRGWLTSETMFEFKFINNPFSLKERVKNRLLYVKLTPMNMRISAESASIEDSSVSNDTRENTDRPGNLRIAILLIHILLIFFCEKNRCFLNLEF